MKLILVMLSVAVSGCALVAQHLGAAASTVQISQTADVVKLLADTTSTVTSGRTVMDHALGGIRDQDCNSFRLLQGQTMCVNRDPVLIQQHGVCM